MAGDSNDNAVSALQAEVSVLRAELASAHEQLASAQEALQSAGVQATEASKLEAIGRLAGGVAHDFNNVLTVVASNAGLLQRANAGDDTGPLVEDILEASRHGRLLVGQLLAFASRQVVSPDTLRVGPTLRELQRLLGRLVGTLVTIDLRLAPDVGSIHMDRGQFEQCILNLATNAREAMPDHVGRIEIRASRLTVGGPMAVWSGTLEPGDWVAIDVEDDGNGMSAEVLDRIFEPFFTTRENQGTGLGLATVWGTVRQNGGHVDVRSEVGEGATFTLYLPAHTVQKSPGTETPAPPRRHSRVRLLVAEDDAQVRRALSAIARHRGYEVVLAASGEEALQRLGDSGPFDVLVTDVMMPGIRGWELADRAREAQADLPVVFMTGYAPDVAGVPANLDDPLLTKPFTPQLLVAAVERVLT